LTELIVPGSRWVNRVHAFLAANVSDTINEYQYNGGAERYQAFLADAFASGEVDATFVGAKLLSADPANGVTCQFGDNIGAGTGAMWNCRAYGGFGARIRRVNNNPGIEFSLGGSPAAAGCILKITDIAYALWTQGAERLNITDLFFGWGIPDVGVWHDYVIGTSPAAAGETLIEIWRDPQLPGYAVSPTAAYADITIPDAELNATNKTAGLYLVNNGAGGSGVRSIAHAHHAVFWPSV
jgi:hypothetical protein